jgi:hypothetical protein
MGIEWFDFGLFRSSFSRFSLTRGSSTLCSTKFGVQKHIGTSDEVLHRNDVPRTLSMRTGHRRDSLLGG